MSSNASENPRPGRFSWVPLGLLLVDFKFDSGGKLQLGTYKYLKETYERLAKNV